MLFGVDGAGREGRKEGSEENTSNVRASGHNCRGSPFVRPSDVVWSPVALGRSVRLYWLICKNKQR